MGLIHHQQLEQIGRQLRQAPGQGLDAGHLHRCGQVHRAAGSDHPMAHPHRRQGTAGLIEQFGSVHQHGDAVAAGGRLLGDVTEDHRLATTGGQYKDHGAMASHERLPHPLDGLLLVGAQGERHAGTAAPCQSLGLPK